MDRPQEELKTALSALSKSGKFSDFTILCQGRRYPVHKALLCSRSRFFDGAFNGHFAESRTGEIDLSEDDEEAVKHMIHYFYHLDYLDEPNTVEEANVAPIKSRKTQIDPVKLDLSNMEDPLLATAHASKAHQSSDLINLPGPREGATSTDPNTATGSPTQSGGKYRRRQSALKPKVDRFSVHENGSCENSAWQSHSGNDEAIDATEDEMESEFLVHARVYALAEKYGIHGLKALAKAKFETLSSESWDDPGFLDAVEEVYTTTIEQDRGLRDVILQVFRKHPDLVYRLDVQDAVKDVPTLAHDLNRTIPSIAQFAVGI
ncbi:MAG: hypothetical protein M1831_000069 [Alyxoria varia]|nr:MAG: hypothetical protein M1831_000069 [Alyxoria varia]